MNIEEANDNLIMLKYFLQEEGDENWKKYCEAIETLPRAYEKEKEKNKELEDTLKQTQNSWYEDTKVIEKQSKEIEESEQKEKQAYIKGTNDVHELCNKMWKDKIKAKIEFIKSLREKIYYEENVISILESLLYKGVDKNENRR